MARIDLARVMGHNGDEEKGSMLSGVRQSCTSRPSRKTLWTFAAMVVVLQGLLVLKWFFYDQEVVVTPPYDVNETVGLVAAYYELLRDMRYLGRDSIAYPPHVGDKAINRTLAIDILGLDAKVYETLLLLPYITPYEDAWDTDKGRLLAEEELADKHASEASWWGGWMGQTRTIFWRNGHFVDYRSDGHLLLSRDPLLETNFRPNKSMDTLLPDYGALPKSAIPLSFLRFQRFGLVLVLDTASNRIVVLDTQSSGSKDPFFDRFKSNKWPLHYKIPKTKFYGQEMHGRLAPDLLREFIHLTSHLEPGYIPGSIRTDELYTPELSPPKWERWIKDLYKQYGWPSAEPLEECQFLSLRRQNHTCDHDPMKNFQAPAFSAAMAKLRHEISVKYLRDWYCPVPRKQEIIDKMKAQNLLTDEQLAYAKSDEPVIPLNLESWGGNLVFMQSGPD
ncbi:uncharacterized protein LY89DRAFT_506284 [Mollisia scopiformis]|uniref:Uncharacterized protein n=1 Tax=Mollisia scopiformis TaxID=149040 RepID=A0A194XFD4_MOLSC|nr:uncharacterized protein LY89DRAFT_506284 [Mollisia scopiformis]KUJ18856.1 hypothetical protein LY89DRAFT_506284 [Mollisia scopiformis]